MPSNCPHRLFPFANSRLDHWPAQTGHNCQRKRVCGASTLLLLAQDNVNEFTFSDMNMFLTQMSLVASKCLACPNMHDIRIFKTIVVGVKELALWSCKQDHVFLTTKTHWPRESLLFLSNLRFKPSLSPFFLCN